MKKITCVGYHYTGSGVIDDLFRECDNVYQGEYEAEMKLLYEPDGIADLEYHLVENPTRLGSGLAIKRFIAFAERSSRQFKKVVGEDWDQLAKSYAENLALIKYHGYRASDASFFTPSQKLSLLFWRVVNKFFPKFMRRPKDTNYVPSAITYYSRLNEDTFLHITTEFIENLCHLANRSNKEYVLLDQFVEASNPSKYLRYVKDMKVIVVDRDPRDLYLSRVTINDRALPKDPHDFCLYYRSIRQKQGQTDPDTCLYMKFEDLIYNYEESIDKVLKFIGIDKSHHIHPKRFFDPSVSIKNTRLWQKNDYAVEAMRVIESELSDFLYDYSKVNYTEK